MIKKKEEEEKRRTFVNDYYKYIYTQPYIVIVIPV